MSDRDHYEAYYADKLWAWLPAVYRADDGDDGPLRELTARVGAQAAVLRRSLDRLYDDQSIETSDDWAIAYLADLVATNLVPSLDARGRRLDVAKTVYYRRRKGTVALLEELATDVTAWDVKIVEFFRRLGRTRHGLDPALGRPADTDEPAAAARLQAAEGLVGPLTATPLGGYADLRSADGATKAGTAFDEYAHTADVRRGDGATGWYAIPRLGVFVWRLTSFGVVRGTPVAVTGCDGQFTFDPTGREVPLFAKRTRELGAAWASPEEWQLPAPISATLLAAHRSDLYPASLEVLSMPGSAWQQVPAPAVDVRPGRGRFVVDAATAALPLAVSYHYGFSAPVGAGPYDRRLLADSPGVQPPPVAAVSGGGAALAGALGGDGTVVVGDSLTYDAVVDVTAAAAAVVGENEQRPVVRPAAGTVWTFTGTGPDAALELTGLLVTGGCDIVLAGEFGTVTIGSATLDPGAAGEGAAALAAALDTRLLAPTRLIVEGRVRSLALTHCIAGPIRVRAAGEVEELSVADSVVQAIRTTTLGAFDAAAVQDPTRLALRLAHAYDPLSAALRARLAAATVAALDAWPGDAPPPQVLQDALVADLAGIVAGASLYDESLFQFVRLSQSTLELAASAPAGDDLVRLNRLLLEEAYPLELADLALGTSSGVVTLERTTVLGPAYVHAVEASECILDDRFVVENAQRGCVRFSACAAGSLLPRRYESTDVAPRAPLFTSRDYAHPGYCQLLAGVDRQLIAPADGASISEGGPTGSEPGVFASGLDAVKHRSIRIKYDEFMPVGLSAVVVDVT